MRRHLSILGPLLKHPLLLAIPLYVLFLSIESIGSVRLWIMEPLALANSGAEENDDLSDIERAERALQAKTQQAAALAQENEFLRQTLSQLTSYTTAFGGQTAKPIPAQIILRGDSSNSRHSLLINRGSGHGVHEGYPVTIGNALVGRIKVCTAHTSLVVLITDPSSTVPVCVIPATPQGQVRADGTDRATRGLLRGNASATPRMPRLSVEDVALDAGIQEGMFVVTNDGAGQFPSGLLVGTVSEAKNRQSFVELEVQAAADVSLADIVLVVPHQRPTLDALARTLAGEHNLDVIKK
ncbi:MAG: rod shape-determining protein MreC [Planctomycetes bacterium]|nr:rod shape-determining protein MreC [Planctomycetota bacterium]NUQ35856.1 rod shape-determining protein MreC [Planctomycetaceae bacterium]